MKELIPIEVVERRIFILRGQKVMLSTHLAKLYGVEARALVQAVKRNLDRFPDDFMFQLTENEYKILKSQIVISSWGGLRRARPYAFTEQGVAMLSTVLNSKKAIHVNIAIMRTFVKLRQILSTHKDLAQKLNDLERKFKKHDQQISAVFDAIRQLMTEPERSKKQIGFKVG